MKGQAGDLLSTVEGIILVLLLIGGAALLIGWILGLPIFGK